MIERAELCGKAPGGRPADKAQPENARPDTPLAERLRTSGLLNDRPGELLIAA